MIHTSFNDLSKWNDLSRGAQSAIIALVLAQLTVSVFALIQLARTPNARLRWMPRFKWVIAIIFGELVGSLVFLFLGRLSESAAESQPTDRLQTGDTIETLYGERHG